MRREMNRSKKKPMQAKDNFVIKTDDGEYMVEKGDSFYVYSNDEDEGSSKRTSRKSTSRRRRSTRRK